MAKIFALMSTTSARLTLMVYFLKHAKISHFLTTCEIVSISNYRQLEVIAIGGADTNLNIIHGIL